ncbi:MAG: hypothetical protein VZR95_07655 [Alphaproteobacteria bacterium]
MDDSFLRRTLHEQCEPLDLAVQKKLEYLKSDDVFSLENYTEEKPVETEMSVEDAFAAFTSAQPNNIAEKKPAGLNSVASKPFIEIKVEEATAETINTHKQNIAARIAALRGISMPGDYALKK